MFIPSLATLAGLALLPAAVAAPTTLQTVVTVRNDLDQPVKVYLEHGAVDVRLGTVAAGASVSFEVPSWLTGDRSAVDLWVHPVRGFDQNTGPIELRTGEHLEVIVPARGPVKTRHAADPAPAWGTPTTVVVQNNLKDPVRVYAERGAFDIRLGVVPAGGDATLAIPAWMVEESGSVTVYVRTSNGVEQRTGLLEVHRGERLGVVVPAR